MQQGANRPPSHHGHVDRSIMKHQIVLQEFRDIAVSGQADQIDKRPLFRLLLKYTSLGLRTASFLWRC